MFSDFCQQSHENSDPVLCRVGLSSVTVVLLIDYLDVMNIKEHIVEMHDMYFDMHLATTERDKPTFAVRENRCTGSADIDLCRLDTSAGLQRMLKGNNY